MAFNLLKKNKNIAKINSTLMIALSTSSKRQRQRFDLAIERWNRHVNTNDIRYMRYNNRHDTKKLSICYFSPYTFDCFLKYLRNLINNNTVIPHTNGKTLDGFKVTTSLYDNVPKTNKEGKILTNKKNQLYVSKVDKLKEYPDVKYNNVHDYASFIIYNLLFFSYDQETLDDEGNNLKEIYKNNKSIADEFKTIFKSEYKDANGKPLSDKNFAHMPSYKSFTNINRDDLYIPSLTTSKQKAYAKSKLRSNNINIYNLDSPHSKNNLAVLKTATMWKEMHEKDKSVDKLIHNDTRRAQTESKERALKSATSIQKHKKEAEEWRASVARAAKSDEAKSGGSNASRRQLAESKSASARRRNEELDQKVAYNGSKSNSANKGAKPLAINARKNNRRQNQSNLSHRNHKALPQHNNRNNRAQHKNNQNQVPSAKRAHNEGNNQRRRNYRNNQNNRRNNNRIDYSSVRQPYLITNNPEVLAEAIHDMVHNKQFNFIKPVHFQLLDVDKHMPKPESPEVALKSGQLDNQRYVQEEANEFKKIANSFIKHAEHNLNLREEESEINAIHHTYIALIEKVQQLTSQYSDDRVLENRAAKYYKVNYHQALVALQKSRDKELKATKKSLMEEFNGRYDRAQVGIYRYFDNQQQQIENVLNKDTIEVYNDSRTRRNKEIHELIREAKRDVSRTIRENLLKNHLRFKKQASESGQLLFGFFTRRLKQNKHNWINTVSKIIETQVKQDTAKTKLKKATIEANHTKDDSIRRTKLAKEIIQERKLVNNTENRLEKLQDKFLNMREKLLKNADSNANLHNKIDDLKENLNTHSTETVQNLQSSRNMVKQLRKALQRRETKAEKLNNSITKLTQNHEDTTVSLANVKSSLKASRMQTSQYKKMLTHQQSQTYLQSQRYASLEQKYVRTSLAAEHGNATLSSQKASSANQAHSASVSRSISASFSASVSTQNSLQKSSMANMKSSLSSTQSKASAQMASSSASVSASIAKQSSAEQKSASQAKSQSESVSKSESVSESKSVEQSSVQASKSVSIATSQNSSAKSSLSASASKARSSATSTARSSAISQAKSSISASRSTSLAKASESASLTTSSISASVSSARASASSAVLSASKAQASKVASETKSNTQARSKAQTQAKAKMASYKASSAQANSLAKEASLKASASVSASLSTENSSASNNENQNNLLKSIRASATRSASLSASASVAKVEIVQSASIKARSEAISEINAKRQKSQPSNNTSNNSTNQQAQSANSSTNTANNNEDEHQKELNNDDNYVPHVSAKERVQQMTIENLKQKMNHISAQERRNSNHGHHHKFFWQS